MSSTVLTKLVHTLKKWLKGYYNILLISVVLLFIFRPYDRSATYSGIWKLFLTIVFLSAVFNSNHKSLTKKITFILAIPAIILSWINLFHPEESLFVADALVTVLFMFICTCSILYDVVLRARVTLETLRGVICAYFMFAFAFAYMYYLTEYLTPHSFHFSNREIYVSSYMHYLSEMLYFSFVTLLTIGYGDITATSDIGQTFAVMEGIIGQFYIAILVARLVSVYSFFSDKKLLRAIKADHNSIDTTKK